MGSSKPFSGRFDQHRTFVREVFFNQDNKTIISASHDQVLMWDTSVLLKDPSADPIIQTLDGFNDHITAFALSPDGTIIATSSGKGALEPGYFMPVYVHLWDTKTGTLLNRFDDIAGSLGNLAFSFDGKWLASSTPTIKCDNISGLWDITVGKNICTDDFIPWGRLSWSPTDLALALGYFYDGTISLWSPDEGIIWESNASHATTVTAVSWSSDGASLASASEDGVIMLWDGETGELITSLMSNSSMVSDLAWAPDKQILAAGISDGRVILWDTANAQQIGVLVGHTEKIQGLAFNPDGEILATGTADHTIILWGWETQTQLTRLAGHTDVLVGVAWPTTGDFLVSASRDGTIVVWDID